MKSHQGCSNSFYSVIQTSHCCKLNGFVKKEMESSMRGGQKERNSSPMATTHVFSGNWRLLRIEWRDRSSSETGGSSVQPQMWWGTELLLHCPLSKWSRLSPDHWGSGQFVQEPETASSRIWCSSAVFGSVLMCAHAVWEPGVHAESPLDCLVSEASSFCFSSTQITDRHILSCLVFYAGARDGTQALRLTQWHCVSAIPRVSLWKREMKCGALHWCHADEDRTVRWLCG